MDSTIQQQVKYHFLSYKQEYPIRNSWAVLGNKDGSNFLENDNTQPPKMLPLPCCLQSSMPESLCVGAIHRCCEWSSPSCLLVVFKKVKIKKAIRNHHISMKGRKLFSFKSWLAEYLPTLCMFEFKQRRQIPTRKGNTAMPLPHWASSVFCYNWMKGRFSSCATSDLQSNSNERGKGEEEGRKEYKPVPPRSLSTQPLIRTLPVATYLSACLPQHSTLKKRRLDTPCMTAK